MNRLVKQYGECLRYERANYHRETEWHAVVGPLAAPEFALVNASGTVLYRWSGVTEMDEFTMVLEKHCVH